MNIQKQVNITNGGQSWLLEFSGLDLARVNLNKFDLALMRECEKSNLISDKLLMLEMLARRLEEQTPKPPKEKD